MTEDSTPIRIYQEWHDAKEQDRDEFRRYSPKLKQRKVGGKFAQGFTYPTPNQIKVFQKYGVRSIESVLDELAPDDKASWFRYAKENYGAEEGNAPIQDPMELGEMANWTPLDGSEGLKRKRAEDDYDDYVFCEGCGEERKSVGPDSVFTIDNARGDVLDDGNVLCDRCHTRGYKIERDAESVAADFEY